MRLMDTLKQIKKENLVSFHMPGHKNGRLLFKGEDNLLKYDITEIPGADYLHDAQGCISETESEISKLYGSEKSKILVNGSTVGILSMILGSTAAGDKVLVNRNAHKSVYNAIEMNGLTPVYLFPSIDDYLGIPTNLIVDTTLKLAENVKICILTYPTYEGLCYSIKDIIEICHKHKIPVLVDEAHGAHLFLHENGPKSALNLGADIVVQSFHKTLPAMTQTAVLHFGKNNLLTEFQVSRVNWYLKSLQSSSPSYILMASVDRMLSIVQDQGTKLSSALDKYIENFYIEINSLEFVKAHRFDAMDITKIILKIPPEFYLPGIWDGNILADKLRSDYGLQVEYATMTMALLMTSISNNKDDFRVLTLSLVHLDTKMKKNKTQIFNVTTESNFESDVINTLPTMHYESIYKTIALNETLVLTTSQAVHLKNIEIPCESCVGEISAEYVIPYPPGIPILVPGERIHEDTLKLFPSGKDRIKVLL